ncbi:MAG TPA: phosphatidylserine decarboxylase [Gammaproteobacteria bacterium]|nr:phosphatidylserine decarboxylase [Gammaproteobacteria bacterium]
MIAREGVAAVLVTLSVGMALAFFESVYAAAPAFGLVAVLIWLYRVPRRRAPAVPLGLLSPVDGRVSRIEPCPDTRLDRPALRISIEVTPPGITVFFSATEGKVQRIWTSYGPFGEERLKRSLGASPDCYTVQVQSDEGEDVLMAVSSRWPLSRCRFDHSPGERVGQGGRLGFVYFASSFELLAPADAAPRVEVGDRVRAVSSLLAELKRD